MTNFIFSRSIPTSKKFANTLQVILTEQRHQRADLNEIKFMLHKLLHNKDLQETVDKYYDERSDPDDPGVSSPQEQDSV